MNTYTEKNQPMKGSATSSGIKKTDNISATSWLTDNRAGAVQAKELKEIANNSPQAVQAAQLQAMADDYTAQLYLSEERDMMPVSSSTKLPQKIINGVEKHLQVNIAGTNVIRNSSKPAQLGAHAVAEGNTIDLGPGKEQYLAHEAVHIGQQLKGEVKPTGQVNGVAINDNPALEKEADDIGAKIR